MSTLTLAPAAASAAALPPEPNASLLRMAIGDDVLAVSIEHVREILQVGRLTPLPRTPAFVRGVMNLRGAVVPVIDLGARRGAAGGHRTREAARVGEHAAGRVDDALALEAAGAFAIVLELMPAALAGLRFLLLTVDGTSD